MSTTNKDAFNLYCTNLRDRYVKAKLHGCIHQEAGDVFLFFVNWVEWPFKFKGLMVFCFTIILAVNFQILSAFLAANIVTYTTLRITFLKNRCDHIKLWYCPDDVNPQTHGPNLARHCNCSTGLLLQ